jgi:predicted ester cyclase
MTTTEIRDIYSRYIDAVNARQFDRMAEFVHDQMILNDQPISRDDYVATMREVLLDTMSNFLWTLDDLVIEDSRVAARLTGTGTPIKSWFGHAPSGRSVTFREDAFYRFRDGRIEQVWVLLDAQGIERQLRGDITAE